MQKNNVFNQISLTHRQILLFNKIKRKGRDEQESQYLFPGLYGQKALTKRERGAWNNSGKYNLLPDEAAAQNQAIKELLN